MNKLREVRVVKRVTQFELRLTSGVHQSKLSLIENGLVTPSPEEIQKIAAALKVKPREIWEHSKAKSGELG